MVTYRSTLHTGAMTARTLTLLSLLLACGGGKDTDLVAPTDTPTDPGATPTQTGTPSATGTAPPTSTGLTGTSTGAGTTGTPQTTGTGPQSCSDQTTEQACIDQGCAPLYGWPEGCDAFVVTGAFAGCVEAGMGCAQVITYAEPPAGGACWVFADACLPQGWTTGCAPSYTCDTGP